MLYREVGQFKNSYIEDSQIFPLRQDRVAFGALLAFAVLLPTFASAYWLNAILVPFMIASLSALGLNILMGYAGQVSLGTGAFMAVGAVASYNFILRIPDIPFLLAFILGGLCAALVGIVFGLPSLRVRGFYLAVSTLACQFFVTWALTKFPWFSNYSTSGVISAQKMVLWGIPLDTPQSKYWVVLGIVIVLGFLAKNLVRSATGRAWMAVRDMDVAAEVIGIRMMHTKLLAFAVSSFYCGIAGALYTFAYLGNVEVTAFELDLSFRVMFMVILGGMGSILGSFLGAGFIVLFPIFLNTMVEASSRHWGWSFPAGFTSNMELLIFGMLIVFFLVVEPNGLARVWQIVKEKMRLWPFPH